jgi:CRISPR/Cas system-associated exonuclease Cas4 (RecB family)
VLLRALRVLERSPDLTYKQLRERLGAPACAAPARPEQALDARDAWIAALAEGPVLLDGEEAVRSAFPMLDEGLVAQAIRAGDQLTGHHGMVPGAAGLLDPRRAGARPVSPSSLELLAACPLAWFHKYGLGLRPPTDPTYDPEAWLDAMERGELLHEIYERFTLAYEGRQREIAAREATVRMQALADEVLARWRAEVPPPSEAVYASEAAELRQAALAFLTLEREALARADAGEWMKVELPFGVEQPVRYELGPGMLVPVQGRIDRVDRLPNGQLVVVDYKTGSPNPYRSSPKMGPFRGGRRLQAAVYAAAAEALLHAEVARFEYRFPTLRGQNEVVRYGREAMLSARRLVAALLEHAERGEFVTTTDPKDCKYCDSRPICRVADGAFNSVVSPRAEWAEANAGHHEVYRGMLARRAPA